MTQPNQEAMKGEEVQVRSKVTWDGDEMPTMADAQLFAHPILPNITKEVEVEVNGKVHTLEVRFDFDPPLIVPKSKPAVRRGGNYVIGCPSGKHLNDGRCSCSEPEHNAAAFRIVAEYWEHRATIAERLLGVSAPFLKMWRRLSQIRPDRPH